MKASVIIPAHDCDLTLPHAIASVNEAAKAVGENAVEVVVSWDREGHGPSWARNRGLDRATGDCVFFCDADDTVEKDFLAQPMAALERTGADICLFAYNGCPPLQNYTLEGAKQIRAAYLPAFFGYSFADVRRWNDGGDLYLLKEPGSVCRCAFRRSFLERNAIRFDESMTFYEDAAFLAHCVAFAEKTVSLSDVLYCYRPRPGGNLASGSNSRRHWDYKFLVLEFRQRLDALVREHDGGGEGVWKYCAASCVFSALEMLKLGRRAGLSRRERRDGLRAYLADAAVKQALADFPCGLRHPLTALAVAYLRWLASGRKGSGGNRE